MDYVRAFAIALRDYPDPRDRFVRDFLGCAPPSLLLRVKPYGEVGGFRAIMNCAPRDTIVEILRKMIAERGEYDEYLLLHFYAKACRYADY